MGYSTITAQHRRHLFVGARVNFGCAHAGQAEALAEGTAHAVLEMRHLKHRPHG